HEGSRRIVVAGLQADLSCDLLTARWYRRPEGSQMPFPDSKRVFYGKNPLDEVICQVRFPPVLRIDTEPPAGFQERVRAAFPLYRSTAPAQISLPSGVPQQLLQIIAGVGSSTHEFLTADQVWKLSLARDFLALTTSRYHDWPNFRARLEGPLA